MKRIIVCRSAPPIESLLPDAQLGYACEICEEPLQITAGGRCALAENPQAKVFCNDCALVYVHLAEDSGEPIATSQSPAAQLQLDQDNDSPLANWVRKRS
jgi:hypothetical protein